MYNYRKFSMQEYDILYAKGIGIGEIISDFEAFISGKHIGVSDIGLLI